MPLTRNQKLALLFNKPSWPPAYDRMMMELLEDYSRQIPTLKSRGIFTALLRLVYVQMAREFGYAFSLSTVKKRVQLFRTNFYAFRQFILLPGVHYSHETNKVTVDGNYWDNFQGNHHVSKYNSTPSGVHVNFVAFNATKMWITAWTSLLSMVYRI